MSIARPTGYPAWASGAGATNITEPTSGQKNTGWTTNQAPPSSYFNWLLKTGYQWTQYLDEAIGGPGFTVKDDFTGDQLDFAKWVVGGTNYAKRADATAGAFGAFEFINASGTSVQTLLVPPTPFGTGNWFIEGMFRTDKPQFSNSSGGLLTFGLQNFTDSTFAALMARAATNGGNWMIALNGGTTLNVGVAPSPAYQRIRLERMGPMLNLAVIGPTGVAVATSFGFTGTFGRNTVAGLQLQYNGGPTHFGLITDYISIGGGTSR